MLDSLPDGIIIADNKQINYLNQEAWKLLGCQSNQEECTNIEDIVCLDTKNCSMSTPLDQLINFLTAVDHRIADIDRDSFLSEMIELATDDAILLHMHQGLVNPCDEDSENEVGAGEDDSPDGDQSPSKKRKSAELQNQEADPDFNGTYYDVRIKMHYFGT